MTASLRRPLLEADRRVAARLRRRAAVVGHRRAGSAADPDGGFALLETVISISLIVLVMAAFSTFFVNTVAYTSLQRATQTATAIANSQLEIIRALPASDLVSGRDLTSVTAQLGAAPASVTGALAGMTVGVGAAVDALAVVGSGATARVPTTPTATTLNGTVYNTSVYLGNCGIATGLVLNANCAASLVSTGYLRAVVAVTWKGSRCPTTGCTYVTSTLLNTGQDPLFSPTPTPPPAPVLTNPGNQTSAVGDVVGVTAVPTAVGLSLITLTGVLPAGLFVNPVSGLISGSPVTVAPATPVTLTLTDGFGRTTSVTFTWTVIPALTPTAPPAQAGVIGTAVPALTVSASGGTTPYTWSDPTASLPPGLSLTTTSDSGVITGTPTTFATFPVTLLVTDAVGRTSTVAFTWTIDYPPFSAANPGPQKSTVGVAAGLVLTTTGGSGSFVWSGGPTLPAGMTLTPAGAVSGTPTTAGTTTVTLVATDTKTTVARTVSFTWTVFPRPTVTAPGNQQSVTNGAVSVQVGANCPNSPCTFVLNNAPATLGISNTGLITGTITSSPQTFAAVTVTMTDSAGASVTSSSFSWTVYGQSTVTAPGAQQSVTGATVSLQVVASCPNAPCTFRLDNGPATLGISSTGLITGTITSSPQTFAGVTVTVTDGTGTAVKSTPFSWIVYGRSTVTSPGNQQSVTGAAVSLQVVASCPNAPCTFRLDNGPATLGISNTGLITGTITSSAQTFAGITVTVTDSTGTAVTSGSFNWVVVGAIPTAPQTVSVINGDSAVTVTWTAPTSGTVTGYTVTLSPGGATCTTTGALSCTVPGLSNGVAYAVTVTASTSSGTGPASTAVRAIPYPSIMSSTNGLSLWLDGTDPNAFAAESGCTGAVATATIGCWKDKSGAGLNFLQTSVANQPRVGSWNGLPAANFTDTGNVLNAINANGVYQTVFVAANLTNPGSQFADLFGQATQDVNVRVGSGVQRGAPNGNDWSYNTANTGAKFNWTNGAQSANTTLPAALITSDQGPSPRTFAASVSNTFMSRGLIGQVGDVITFKRALTTVERRTIEDYLSRKWAVPIVPQQPTSVLADRTTTNNGTNNGSVAVRWTAPALNGATAPTYTVTAPGVA
ncbi:MAG: putative Ig domain-containing protein, partial [Nakamurella sp.]